MSWIFTSCRSSWSRVRPDAFSHAKGPWRRSSVHARGFSFLRSNGLRTRSGQHQRALRPPHSPAGRHMVQPQRSHARLLSRLKKRGLSQVRENTYRGANKRTILALWPVSTPKVQTAENPEFQERYDGNGQPSSYS